MKNIFFAFLTISIFACTSNDPQHIAQEKLWDEMMVIHDEVMPKMGKIRKTSKKLKKYLEEHREQLEPMQTDQIQESIKYLEDAGDSMMSWMNEIGDKKPRKLRGDKSHEEIVEVLNTEIVKITKVKEYMLTSIKSGETVLKDFNIK